MVLCLAQIPQKMKGTADHYQDCRGVINNILLWRAGYRNLALKLRLVVRFQFFRGV